MKKFIHSTLRYGFSALFILVTIELLMWLAKPSPAAFALPSEILREIPKFFLPDDLGYDLLGTLRRTFIAFSLSLPIGIILGVVTIKSRWINRELYFFIDFIRSIPATALIPLFLVLFGTGDISKIAVGVLSGGLVVTVSVIVGYQSLSENRKIISIFIGARTAASLCLILVVVGEMFIGSVDGLGKIIMDRRYSDDVPTLYAAIVMTGLVGYTINMIFVFIESKIKLLI